MKKNIIIIGIILIVITLGALYYPSFTLYRINSQIEVDDIKLMTDINQVIKTFDSEGTIEEGFGSISHEYFNLGIKLEEMTSEPYNGKIISITIQNAKYKILGIGINSEYDEAKKILISKGFSQVSKTPKIFKKGIYTVYLANNDSYFDNNIQNDSVIKEIKIEINKHEKGTVY